jgi:hypothetical protein
VEQGTFNRHCDGKSRDFEQPARKRFETVIASEAKQSIKQQEEWIASSLALLAMTRK